jgi:futalosine hydrolase
MRVLIVAATEFEVLSFKSKVVSLESEVISSKSEVANKSTMESGLNTNDFKLLTADLRLHTPDLEFLITGVGMVATAFNLGKHLANHTYDLAINLGIAGSFDRSIALGELLEITQDTLAELGAEDGQQFISIDQLGFGEGVFSAGARLADYYKNHPLKQATAITVNTVHGNEQSIRLITDRLKPQIESMEGAAFFYACRQFNLPSLQIRAVSNYVEKRNRDAWQIGPAVKNLNSFAADFIKQIRS